MKTISVPTSTAGFLPEWNRAVRLMVKSYIGYQIAYIPIKEKPRWLIWMSPAAVSPSKTISLSGM